MKKPSKSVTLKFFDYKWRRSELWSVQTEAIYTRWYLARYGFQSLAGLRAFLRDKTRILDAGCGQGRVSKMLAGLNPRAAIIAMDLAANALRTARQMLRPFPNCSVVRADITNFRNLGTFDFISCDQVLHHTSDPEKTLRHFYSKLTPGGTLAFSMCRKKNLIRDAVDDAIMERAATLSPRELWKFAEVVTRFGAALHGLNISPFVFGGKRYPNLQRFVHDQVFRAWYQPEIDFQLSVSSNYDWFSSNPRFSAAEVRAFIRSGLGPHKIANFYEDDPTISVVIRKHV